MPLSPATITWTTPNQTDLQAVSVFFRSPWFATADIRNVANDATSLTVSFERGRKIHYEVRAFYLDSLHSILIKSGDIIAGEISPPTNLKLQFNVELFPFRVSVSGILSKGRVGSRHITALTVNGDYDFESIPSGDSFSIIVPNALTINYYNQESGGTVTLTETLDVTVAARYQDGAYDNTLGPYRITVEEPDFSFGNDSSLLFVGNPDVGQPWLVSIQGQATPLTTAGVVVITPN